MALNFLNRTRRPSEPNTGGVSTAVGGVLDPVAQAAQNVATPATTPAPVNRATDLAGGVAGGPQPVATQALPRTHQFGNYPTLFDTLGGVRTNIIDRLLRSRGVAFGPNGLERRGMS